MITYTAGTEVAHRTDCVALRDRCGGEFRLLHSTLRSLINLYESGPAFSSRVAISPFTRIGKLDPPMLDGHGQSNSIVFPGMTWDAVIRLLIHGSK